MSAQWYLFIRLSDFDFDFAIVGSGFGGSVSALRLAEKGYSVAVLEMGKRWAKDDFPLTTWDVRKYLWRPSFGLYGILQMTLVKDAFFLHGAGVGGGSLVYANTLLVPPDEAFTDARWVGQDWKAALEPHYATAKRMLGVTESPVVVETDWMLKEVAEEMGRGHTWKKADVGVFFGEPGKTVPDPFFDGEGPSRTGCTLCGGCMVGCRVGAKNTLDRNYLYLAEKKGVTIQPESRVVDVRPLHGGGYELVVERSTGILARRRTLRVRGVVVSGGSYGTVDLLMRCKERGTLGKLSRRLGSYLRTNSEALLGVRSNRPDVDYSKGIAITSGVFVDDKTHIEVVRYPRGSDALAPLATVLTDGGGWLPRPLRWLATIIRHPLQFLRSVIPFGWAQKSAHPPRDAAGRQPPRVPPPSPVVLAVLEEARQRPRRGRARADVHPDREPRREEAREEDGRHTAERPPRGAPRKGIDGSHPRRLPHRPHRRGRRRRSPEPRVRLRRSLCRRRVGDPGEPRREPEPHDHGDGRARDDPRPGEDRADNRRLGEPRTRQTWPPPPPIAR